MSVSTTAIYHVTAIVSMYAYFFLRHCFVEAMLTNGTLHKGMYNIMQEWYNYINESVHIQADLIGE